MMMRGPSRWRSDEAHAGIGELSDIVRDFNEAITRDEATDDAAVIFVALGQPRFPE